MSVVHDDLVRLRQLTDHLEDVEKSLARRDRRYKTILDNLTEGVLEVDCCGEVVYANPSAEKMFGDACGKYFIDLLENGRLMEMQFSSRLIQEYPQRDVVFLSPEGKRIHTITSSSPLRDNGRSLGIVFTITDITERLIAEERYKAIFDEANIGIWLVDADTREILDANPVTCTQLGYTKEELVGKRVEEIDAVDDAERVAARIQHILDKRDVRFQTRHRRKDGSEISVTMITRALRYNGNRFILSICRYEGGDSYGDQGR